MERTQSNYDGLVKLITGPKKTVFHFFPNQRKCLIFAYPSFALLTSGQSPGVYGEYVASRIFESQSKSPTTGHRSGACSPGGARGDFSDPDFSTLTTCETLVEKSDYKLGRRKQRGTKKTLGFLVQEIPQDFLVVYCL